MSTTHYYLKAQCIALIILYYIPNSILFAQSDPIQKPNVILILVDDMSLMDLGSYGGEASTPHLDQLAHSGIRFFNHHTSPSCAPSRAMLLTGMDSHKTGVPNLPLFLPPEQINEVGYEGILNDTVKTLGTLLKAEGYNTYVSGKWHMGHSPNTLPTKRGFDRSYILDASGADNYEHKAYLPTQSKPPWYQDGKEIDLPEDFYSSRTLVDKLISFIDEEEDKASPFFSYLAFQAIHIPVQAPKEFIANYDGVYDKGWDVIRQERYEKAIELGIIDSSVQLGEMLPFLNSWESQTEEEKQLKAKAMAVNAAMIEAMDFHIGRLMDYLEEQGKLNNTVFLVSSDNGPEGSDPSLVAGMDLWLQWAGYDREYDNLGQRGSWNFIGPEFASAAASPSAYFKFYAGEGGLRVPLIVSGAGLAFRKTKSAFSFVTDVVPTILDIVGASYPQNYFDGKSLYPLIQNTQERIHEEDEYVAVEVAGNAALFKGNMKIVRNGPIYGDNKWYMYDISSDPGETQDLSQKMPELFEEMMEYYREYCEEYGVLEMPEGYSQTGEIKRKFIDNVKQKSMPWIIGILILLGVIVFYKLGRKIEA
ncbi:MAG: arylsulfatase [Bacteroidia bacterium]|nr:arylsulfatase [Bacteroidia bacterium]